MKNLAFECWDSRRLHVNRDFAGILRKNQLVTFDALMQFTGGVVAKNLLSQRVTTRLVLNDDGSRRAFYLKRHQSAPWKEYVKPLLRLTWPILGARNEWHALVEFHKTEIPTMTPVAWGASGRRSFLLTEAIEGYQKLSDWFVEHRDWTDPRERELVDKVIAAVARIARLMHNAGMHHQDFYLGHLLVSNNPQTPQVRVIDLGRARLQPHLSLRWIVKDLAQLDYSAGQLSACDRVRFLREYLGRCRRLDAADKRLVKKIRAKSQAIARHSKKNRL